MNGKSLKVQKAEKFVDDFIKSEGHTPTYNDVKEYMGFKSNAQAYGICAKFRDKMKAITKNEKRIHIEIDDENQIMVSRKGFNNYEALGVLEATVLMVKNEILISINKGK